MNRDKVIIVKQKWDEYSHYSKVKKVFFEEPNAVDFVNKEKLKEENEGSFWIYSDREISDYTPCLDKTETRIMRLEAQQELVDQMFEDGNFDPNILDRYWASIESEIILIKIEESEE